MILFNVRNSDGNPKASQNFEKDLLLEFFGPGENRGPLRLSRHFTLDSYLAISPPLLNELNSGLLKGEVYIRSYMYFVLVFRSAQSKTQTSQNFGNLNLPLDITITGENAS